MAKTGFRTDQLFNGGYRDAAEVMAHEVFELQNTDILETLRTTILKDTQIGTRMKPLIDGIENNTDDEDADVFLNEAFNNEKIGIRYMHVVLYEIKKVTGKDIKYCLWLCDSVQDIRDSYEIEGQKPFQIFDEYEISDIVLSDIGSEGKLYGYESYPVCVRTFYDGESFEETNN